MGSARQEVRQDGGIMRATFVLGTLFGVRIGVNWSVLIIFGLIAYGLSAQNLPAGFPGAPTSAYVAAGLVTAIIFFLSLLAHEMAHALIARRNGVDVEGITLWLFGGVAQLHGEADDPGAELRIAGIGPLVSLVLGGVFYGLVVLTSNLAVPGLVSGALWWLALINVALAVFNAIPAAPLDGGRLLRAFLWWRTRDRSLATVWASRAGQIFGWLLIGGGLVLFFSGDLGGLWLSLIGWFLVSAASVEGQQAVVRQRLGGIPVWQVMTPEPMTVPESMTVAEFLDTHLMRHRHATFPVTDSSGSGDSVVGLVTFTRIKDVADADRARTSLSDVACSLPDVATASPSEPVADVLPRLTRCAEGRALVFDDRRLVGIIAPSDITRTLERISVVRSPFGRV